MIGVGWVCHVKHTSAAKHLVASAVTSSEGCRRRTCGLVCHRSCACLFSGTAPVLATVRVSCVVTVAASKHCRHSFTACPKQTEPLGPLFARHASTTLCTLYSVQTTQKLGTEYQPQYQAASQGLTRCAEGLLTDGISVSQACLFCWHGMLQVLPHK